MTSVPRVLFSGEKQSTGILCSRILTVSCGCITTYTSFRYEKDKCVTSAARNFKGTKRHGSSFEESAPLEAVSDADSRLFSKVSTALLKRNDSHCQLTFAWRIRLELICRCKKGTRPFFSPLHVGLCKRAIDCCVILRLFVFLE